MSNRDDSSKLNKYTNKALRGVGTATKKGVKKAGNSLMGAFLKLASFFSPAGLFSKVTKASPIIILFIAGAIFLFFAGEEVGENTGKDKNVVDNENRPGSSYYSDDSDTDTASSTNAKSTGTSVVNGNGNGDDAVEEALKYVGGNYVHGGADPGGTGADCSGFTMYVMAKFGVSLPHSAELQSNMGEEVPLSDIKAGDLLFYTESGGGIGHVTMYMGGGQVVHASSPKNGIMISDYGYRTPVKARRFLTAGTKDHSVADITNTLPTGSSNTAKKEEENSDDLGVELSPANSASLTFYNEVSEQKSSWQVYDDTLQGASPTDAVMADENTEYIEDSETGDLLIRADSKYAVSDYYKNDKKYFVSPYLLYSMNRYLWGDSYTYPEAFLNPIAHDDGYNLKDLVDENKKVSVKSKDRDKNGEETGKDITSTADYGIASIFKYKKEVAKDEYKGSYVQEDYFDTASGTIKQRDINEEYDIVVNEEERNVLDWVQTFSGYVTYTYSPTSVLVEGVKDGESSNESDNVKKVKYKTESVSVYIVVPKANGENKTAYAKGVIADEEKAKEYCSKHSEYTLYGAEYDDEGNITSAKTANKSYDLYKYRSESSGKYSSFVEIQSVDTTQQSNDYLKQYLGNFDSYKPTSIVRDTEIFQKFTSTGSVSARSKVSDSGTTASGGGDFAACFNDETIGERIKIIWDTALAWGYSEEQAAAALGNWWYESGGAYDPSAVNSSSGAYGVCQWLGGRRDNLYTFAKDYFGEDGSSASFEAQVLFAMMELDYNNSYSWCTCQWMASGHTIPNGTYSYSQLTNDWNTSSDVDVLTLAVCQGWERPNDTDGSLSRRQTFANDALSELSGQNFGLALEVIDPSSSSANSNDSSVKHSGATKSMSEKDRELYNEFYNQTNNLYDGTHTMAAYSNGLTIEKQEEVLLLASSLARNESMNEVKLNLGLELWEENYIVNQSAIDDQNTYAGSLSSADMAKAEEFIDYDFMWPYAKDTVTTSGDSFLSSEKLSSRFGPRVAPTAGATSNHKGLDTKCNSGTKLLAVSDGTVSYVGYDSGGGNWVEVSHGTDAKGREVKSQYFHMSDNSFVTVGQSVKKGDVLGLSGSTGASTGPHLHINILVNGLWYNPLAFYDLTAVPMVDTAGSSKLENVDFTNSLPSDLESSYKQYLYWDGSQYQEW